MEALLKVAGQVAVLGHVRLEVVAQVDAVGNADRVRSLLSFPLTTSLDCPRQSNETRCQDHTVQAALVLVYSGQQPAMFLYMLQTVDGLSPCLYFRAGFIFEREMRNSLFICGNPNRQL